MDRIEKRNGYVYLVEGRKGFETFFNLGKDQEYWDNLEKNKKKKTKKEEPKVESIETIEQIDIETKNEQD